VGGIVAVVLLIVGAVAVLGAGDNTHTPQAAEGYDPPDAPAAPFPPATEPPSPATEPLHDVVSVTAGNSSSCATHRQGTVWCWGQNDDGQLGSAPSGPIGWARPVDSVDGATTAPAVAWGHACVVASERVVCWGANYDGRIGDGTTSPTRMPSDIGIERAEHVASGGRYTCASNPEGLWCWGNLTGDGLGAGTPPTNVLDEPIRNVSVGEEHSCATLRDDGSVWCWGTNQYGELGDGSTKDASRPVRATATEDHDVGKVVAGPHHTCALLEDRTILCWGRGRQGQLGNASEELAPEPAVVLGIDDAVDVAAGGDFTCALHEIGTVSCWGNAFAGQTGSENDRDLYPVEVPGLEGVVSISSGSTHSCAVLTDATVRCWGSNLYGELGGRRASGAVVTVLG